MFSKTLPIMRLMLLFLLVLFSAGVATAKTSCQDTPRGRLCVSQVNFARFAQEAYQQQRMSQWCWAASISMVYNFHNHPVSQERIVNDVYGGIVNMPAGAGFVMARQLNRPWLDNNRRPFRAYLTAAYDFDARVLAINNNWMIRELDQDRPFIVGNRTHAVVATAIQYFVTPNGPQVVGVGVFDPWPGIGARDLTGPELVPMHLGGALRFVATVTVSDR